MSTFGASHQNDGVFGQIKAEDQRLAETKALEAEARQDPNSPKELGAQITEADDQMWEREREKREHDQAENDAQ